MAYSQEPELRSQELQELQNGIALESPVAVHFGGEPWRIEVEAPEFTNQATKQRHPFCNSCNF